MINAAAQLVEAMTSSPAIMLVLGVIVVTYWRIAVTLMLGGAVGLTLLGLLMILAS